MIVPAPMKPMPTMMLEAMRVASLPVSAPANIEVCITIVAPSTMRMCVRKPAGLCCSSRCQPIIPPSTSAPTTLSDRSRVISGVIGVMRTSPGRAPRPIRQSLPAASPAARRRLLDLQERQEGLLRDVDRADALHPLLAFLLLLEQLPLARDVATVALREHVLAQRLHVRARDDLRADCRLDRDLELLARDKLLHLARELLAARERLLAMDDERERVHRVPVDEDVQFDEVPLAP